MKKIMCDSIRFKTQRDYKKKGIYFVVMIGSKYISQTGKLCSQEKARHFRNIKEAIIESARMPMSKIVKLKR